MTDQKPRRLRGHKATATCCVASVDTPGLVATAAEDGCVCWFDMRCKQVVDIMEVGTEAVSSLCFKPGNENMVYVSSGKEVKSFDVRLGTSCSWKVLESYDYNKEEINQIACSSKASFLAAADDGGDIKIVDIRQQRIYKTLRADTGHTSICSSVQFLPWRPWEGISIRFSEKAKRTKDCLQLVLELNQVGSEKAKENDPIPIASVVVMVPGFAMFYHILINS